MRTGGGKQKGTSFERKTAKALSLWLSEGKRDDLLWRSAMSGGRATTGLRTGNRRIAQVGDLSAVDPLGGKLLHHCVVECKSYRNLDFFDGVLNDRGNLYKFWHDLVITAVKFDKQPMLVAHQNGLPPVCLLSAVLCQLFGLTDDLMCVVLPRWRQEARMLLFECFLSEAKVPGELVLLNTGKRVVLR